VPIVSAHFRSHCFIRQNEQIEKSDRQEYSTNVTIREIYRVGQKSKMLILTKYVNKTEKIGGM